MGYYRRNDDISLHYKLSFYIIMTIVFVIIESIYNLIIN